MLYAGAAAVEITPDKPMPLFGYPHVERISTGVHDPILASALCVSSGEETALVVSLDLLFLDPPTAKSLRRTVAEETGAEERNVLISCTHTHSAPVTCSLLSWSGDPAVPAPDPSYLAFVRERTVSAARKASASQRPAQWTWTVARADGAGGNRLSPHGAVDPEVGVLFLKEAKSQNPLALLLVYSMHPTVLHEDSTLVSSDFPHYVRLTARKALAASTTLTTSTGGPVVLYHTGPSGNQSPRRFVRGQTFQEAERLGETVGDAVLASLASLPQDAFRSEAGRAVIQGALREIELPVRPQPSLEEAELLLRKERERFERLRKEKAPRHQVRTAECAVFGAEGALRLSQAQETGELRSLLSRYNPSSVQALRLDDVYLAGLPGELFVEYGLQIKAASPKRVFPICLVNGELQGYIVTKEASIEGGYEAANSVFDPSAGLVLAEAALDLLETMGGTS